MNTEIDNWNDEFGLEEVIIIINEHTEYSTLLRDPRLFDAGIFETHFAWLKEIWNLKTNGLDITSGMPERHEYNDDDGDSDFSTESEDETEGTSSDESEEEDAVVEEV